MIHFVGAGPGGADLITVRGKNLLEKADLIIFAGSLVNPELLTYAENKCEILNSATMTLEEVIAKFKEYDAKGKTIVRLHTGDPSIYGAIREQMDELDEAGIEYDVTPGVSAFCGAAAALKAEYTLPNVSQTVIITRTAGRTPVPERESIEKLASHGSTMCLFLSTALLDKLQSELLAGGYTKDTPAAIVYKATWPDEKIVRGTVGELISMKADNDIEKTALILVGGFLGSSYERSKLYDPSFTHEFRDASV
jgi:precorrin-4/cobalt-precorrin-4 C11-methyltransferase